MKIATYLSFPGTCEEAFDLYAKTLGARVTFKQTFAGSPMADQAPPGWGNKIMHESITVGDFTLMGSDAPPDRYQVPQGTYVSLGVDKPEEGQRIFDALSQGGQVQMPYQKTYWASGFGMFVDRFGTPWMVNCEQPA